MEDLCQVLIPRLKLVKSYESVIVGIKAQEHLSALAQLFSLDLQVGDDGADT